MRAGELTRLVPVDGQDWDGLAGLILDNKV